MGANDYNHLMNIIVVRRTPKANFYGNTGHWNLTSLWGNFICSRKNKILFDKNWPFFPLFLQHCLRSSAFFFFLILVLGGWHFAQQSLCCKPVVCFPVVSWTNELSPMRSKILHLCSAGFSLYSSIPPRQAVVTRNAAFIIAEQQDTWQTANGCGLPKS